MERADQDITVRQIVDAFRHLLCSLIREGHSENLVSRDPTLQEVGDPLRHNAGLPRTSTS